MDRKTYHIIHDSDRFGYSGSLETHATHILDQILDGQNFASEVVEFEAPDDAGAGGHGSRGLEHSMCGGIWGIVDGEVLIFLGMLFHFLQARR